jgi:hypothetical protein
LQGQEKQQFFYDMNAKMEDTKSKGKKRKHENEVGENTGLCKFTFNFVQIIGTFVLTFKSDVKEFNISLGAKNEP